MTVAVFEQAFAEHFGRKYGIMTTSGAAANLLALDILTKRSKRPFKAGGNPGNVIALPALCSRIFDMPGVRKRYTDIDETWNAKAHLHEKAGPMDLVVMNSVLGNPGHLKYWQTISETHGCPSIEDCTEALGAISRDKPGPYRKLCGSFGLISTFRASQNAGMLLTDDGEIFQIGSRLSPRDHLSDRDADEAQDHLEHLEDDRKQRQQNYNNAKMWCMDLPVVFPKQNGVLSPLYIPMKLEDQETRDQLELSLRDAGIVCRVLSGLTDSYWTPKAKVLSETVLLIDCPNKPAEAELLGIVRIMEKVLK